MHHAPGVNEAESVALQTLHDEAFAAEQPDADLLLKRDTDRHTAGRTEKRILLTDERAAQCGQIHRQNATGERRRKRQSMNAVGLIGEHRHEQALAGQDAASRAEQRADDSAALLLTAVAEDRLHLDAGRHVHQRSGFGHGALTRIQSHFDELQVFAEDAEVDVVRAAAGTRRHRGTSGADAATDVEPGTGGTACAGVSRVANCGIALSGAQFFIPAEKSSVFASMLPLSTFDRISSAVTGPT